MIFLLVRPGWTTSLDNLKLWQPSLRSTVRVVEYSKIVQLPDVPAATYIFTYVGTLWPDLRRRALVLRDALVDAGDRVTVLNDPRNVKPRYPLLRKLYELGWNTFNIYRPDEGRPPRRFPVFIRDDFSHRGSLTGLLHNEDEVQQALQALNELLDRRDLLIVEFEDVSDDEGYYRKYAVTRIGDRLIPHDIGLKKRWMVKSNKPPIPKQQAEIRVFSEQEPPSRIMEIFDVAALDYGRIDYGLKDGEVCTWEINSNPWILWRPEVYEAHDRPMHEKISARLRDAFEAIDRPLDGMVSIPW
jgi:hypothetical protein